MPHNIATTNGRPAIAYFGDTPWHRLGAKLDEPASAAEAIEAAGLDYEVELQSLWTVEGEPVPMRQAVVRGDTRQLLGVVGKEYQPIQNRQCFGFLDSIVTDGQLRYHTAGALGKGERIWMLAKLPGEIQIRESADITEKYLLLSNSHDGTSALRVFFTPIRVVCANTLAMAERRSQGDGVSIIHKGNLGAKVTAAQEILGFAKRHFDVLAGKINELASFYPTRLQLESYFQELYPDREGSKINRARNIRSELSHLFEAGRGQDIPETRLTAWAAYNAVTEFVDHHRSTRGRTDQERASHRLQSAWFGSGGRLKTKAWREALMMLN